MLTGRLVNSIPVLLGVCALLSAFLFKTAFRKDLTILNFSELLFSVWLYNAAG